MEITDEVELYLWRLIAQTAREDIRQKEKAEKIRTCAMVIVNKIGEEE
jgi:hypothetical protein